MVNYQKTIDIEKIKNRNFFEDTKKLKAEVKALGCIKKDISQIRIEQYPEIKKSK